MAVIPENEKVIKLDQDDEGWVDTHHGISELMVTRQRMHHSAWLRENFREFWQFSPWNIWATHDLFWGMCESVLHETLTSYRSVIFSLKSSYVLNLFMFLLIPLL